MMLQTFGRLTAARQRDEDAEMFGTSATLSEQVHRLSMGHHSATKSARPPPLKARSGSGSTAAAAYMYMQPTTASQNYQKTRTEKRSKSPGSASMHYYSSKTRRICP